MKISYCDAILAAFDYLLRDHPNVFVIGQGVWSPWYVGNTMKGLDVKFGRHRIIDTPVSENACTGAAVGASMFGYRPIIVHPRMDFMLYCIDPIVNQAAKWSYMFGGRARPSLTIRSIINRGGEQGAQHSQALHAWFAHIPGIRVVMPATAEDAQNLLIASVLCDDPVLYVDDRWLYSVTGDVPDPGPIDIRSMAPKVLRSGKEVTIVGAGWTTSLALSAAEVLAEHSISAEVVDLRVLNPMEPAAIIASVNKTGRLIAVDGGWSNCGLAGEIITRVAEALPPSIMRSRPVRITLPDAPAPTSGPLEAAYYPKPETIVAAVLAQMGTEK